MANLCYNSINIFGDKDILDKLMNEVTTDGKLDFNKIIPYPKEYADADANSQNFAGFNGGGYEWRLENWGNKWNAVEEATMYREEDELIQCSFDSAWSPPEPVIAKLSELYPVSIIHYYDEGGMCFEGENRYVDGEKTELYFHEGKDYPNNDWALDDEEE